MLFNELAKLEPDFELLVNANEALSAERLYSLRKKYLPALKAYEGKTVAVEFSKNIDMAKWMLMLDGVVKTLLILPIDLPKQTREDFLVSVSCDCVIGDNSELCGEKVGAALEECNTEWLVATSGTTNTPKLVRHITNTLTCTTKKGRSSFTWGLLYGLHRFAGIQVFLQSILSGNKLVVKESSDSLNSTMALFEREKVDSLSGTPTLYRNLFMVEGFNKLSFKNISLGGEIADQKILDALNKSFPKASVRHIYASTEAGVGFSVGDGIEGFPADFFDNSDGRNFKLKLSEDNTLMIKSNAAARSYVGDQAFLDDEGYVDTGDLVEVNNDRYLFQGRLSGVINVGGNKVVPEAVETTILALSFVSKVRVYAKKSPIMGSLVCADVELIRGKDFNRQEIINFCKENLKSYQVPALVKLVDKIEVTSTGKVKR